MRPAKFSELVRLVGKYFRKNETFRCTSLRFITRSHSNVKFVLKSFHSSLRKIATLKSFITIKGKNNLSLKANMIWKLFRFYRTHQCSFCNKFFGVKADLRNHISFHHTMDPKEIGNYYCKLPYSKFRFVSLGNLTCRLHLREKLYIFKCLS